VDAMKARRRCLKCFGDGVFRNRETRRFDKCDCGRLPNVKGISKLAKQEKLDKRLQELREKGW
jgi:hypothetical protein